MLSLKNILSPIRQNAIQRRGFFGSLAIASLVLFLHFPFEGYDIERYVITRYGYGPCPSFEGVDAIMNATSKQLDQYVQELRRCSDDGEMQIRPFYEWKSKAPIIEWFGSVIHAVVAFVFALLLGGIWLWVFRTHGDDKHYMRE